LNYELEIEDLQLFRNHRRGFLMNQKAQVTVFIIAGIIILISAGLYIGVKEGIIETEFAPEIETTLEEVPIEFMPVRSFMELCVKETAEEGIRTLGKNGGFINPVRYGIITTSQPTESDAVKLDPASDLSIPYWYHMKSPNDCFGQCDFLTIPDNMLYLHKQQGTPSIQGQLEEYMDDNLNNCLEDFKALKDQGFNVNVLGDIKTQISIQDNEIQVLVDYPLEFTKTSKKEISKFFVKIPVNLRGTYNLAKEIVDLQAEYRYLEKHLLNLITGYSAVKSNRLPPMHETIIRFGGETTWQVNQVKRDIKQILSEWIQPLQVSNTANYEPIYGRNRLEDALYNSGMLIPVNGNYPDLEVSFMFHPDWWPIYFKINCKSGTCSPESISSNLLAIIGIQRYNFVYDVSYPVQVEIRNPSAFNYQGYTFQFAMESNIRANDVMEPNYIPWPIIDTGDSMFCDADKRNSGDITINVFDYDNYKLSNANIIYTCFDQSCNLGKTEMGTITTKFPSCLGGTVSVVKPGFLAKSKPFDVNEGTTASMTFNLNPIRVMKFIVKKKLIEKRTRGIWFPTLRVVELKENEDAIILLEKVGDPTEEKLQSSASYKGNQTEPSEIRIGEGDFKVTIYLMLDETIVIPRTEIEDEEIPRQELPKPYQSGGLIANFTFTNYNLKNSDQMVFYALSPNLYDVPERQRSIEDLEFALNIEEYSKYWYGAWPRFE